jgi:hypothetical protein
VYTYGIFTLAIGFGDHLFSEGGAYVTEGPVQHHAKLPKCEFRTLEKIAKDCFSLCFVDDPLLVRREEIESEAWARSLA